MSVLRLRDLSVSRGGRPLIAGLSLTLEAGQCAILRGPNGAGKTTLLRSIAGLRPIDAGKISGEEPAYGGHADGLKASLTVAENLGFWAASYGQIGIAPAVSAWDLQPLLERPAAALSAGQKRRVGLARLMVTGRKLWLLDEPTTALDQQFVDRFCAVLTTHLQGGGAALVSTHVPLAVAGQELDLSHYKPAPDASPVTDEWAGVL